MEFNKVHIIRAGALWILANKKANHTKNSKQQADNNRLIIIKTWFPNTQYA